MRQEAVDTATLALEEHMQDIILRRKEEKAR